MFKYIFEKTLIPKITSLLILVGSVFFIYNWGDSIIVTDDFKSSYMTVLSILFGFFFSIIIFVNEQLAQIGCNSVIDDTQKRRLIRYTKFYGFLIHRLLLVILFASILLIVMLVSYLSLTSLFGDAVISIAKWIGKVVLCCAAFISGY